jgi:hypothetical protein
MKSDEENFAHVTRLLLQQNHIPGLTTTVVSMGVRFVRMAFTVLDM